MDLGAQEEFVDNFWCFVKLRCSTLYFSASEICIFGFGGSVRPKPSLASPKLAQNRSKRAQKAKPSFYRWFAVSGWPTGHTHRYFLPLDSIGTFRDGESGCDKCVTKVWQIFVTHLSHMCHIGFRPSWGEEPSKTKLYDRNRYCARAMCCLDSVLVALRSNTTAKCVTNFCHGLSQICHTEFSAFWSRKIKNKIVSPK